MPQPRRAPQPRRLSAGEDITGKLVSGQLHDLIQQAVWLPPEDATPPPRPVPDRPLPRQPYPELNRPLLPSFVAHPERAGDPRGGGCGDP